MNSYDNATKSPKENKFTGPVFSLPGGKIGTQLQRNCAKKGGRREEEEEEGEKENWLKRDLPKQFSLCLVNTTAIQRLSLITSSGMHECMKRRRLLKNCADTDRPNRRARPYIAVRISKRGITRHRHGGEERPLSVACRHLNLPLQSKFEYDAERLGS